MSTASGSRPYRILFPTAFSEDEVPAFQLALRLTLEQRGHLTMLHVGAQDREHVPWHRFPRVRKTLEEWGVLEPGSKPDDVNRVTGISVRKQALHARGVRDEVVRHLEAHHYDLLVMATEGRSALVQLVAPSSAEPIADRSGTPALFMPVNAPAPLTDGKAELDWRHILVPVNNGTVAERAIPSALAMAALSTSEEVRITLLHVGQEGKAWLDRSSLPGSTGVTWHRMAREGEVIDTVLAVAGEEQCDLIVMATHGTDSLADALLGTTTERILRQGHRPLLAVPMSHRKKEEG